MMRCGYMILTFLLALAVVSPVLYVLVHLYEPFPSEPAWHAFVIVIGAAEIVCAILIGGFVAMLYIPEMMWKKAKAEFDALKAGMRGEK